MGWFVVKEFIPMSKNNTQYGPSKSRPLNNNGYHEGEKVAAAVKAKGQPVGVPDQYVVVKSASVWPVEGKRTHHFKAVRLRDLDKSGMIQIPAVDEMGRQLLTQGMEPIMNRYFRVTRKGFEPTEDANRARQLAEILEREARGEIVIRAERPPVIRKDLTEEQRAALDRAAEVEESQTA